MIRRAFTMKLKPGATEEYIRHHNGIPHEWSQLVDEIRNCGIAQITTFQNGLDLFLYSQIDNEKAWDKLWNSEIHRKWAALMEPLMHLDENGIVEAGELTEIFHLETRPE
jgi:L-rhamnose mutarotase